MSQSGKRPLKIGLFLPLIEDHDQGGVTSWSDLMAMAKLAEDAGFDSIWVADHTLFRFDDIPPTHGRWECWSLLAALAATT